MNEPLLERPPPVILILQKLKLHDSRPDSADVMCERVLTRLKPLSVRDKTPQCIVYVFKTTK